MTDYIFEILNVINGIKHVIENFIDGSSYISNAVSNILPNVLAFALQLGGLLLSLTIYCMIIGVYVITHFFMLIAIVESLIFMVGVITPGFLKKLYIVALLHFYILYIPFYLLYILYGMVMEVIPG